MMRVLLVSPDPDWREFLCVEFKPMEIEAVGLCTAGEALALLQDPGDGCFDGACVSALPAAGQSESEWILQFRGLVSELREKMGPKFPILLWSRFLSERRMQLLAGLFETDHHISRIHTDDPAALAAALSRPGANQPPSWAAIELEIGANVRITVDGGGAATEEHLPDARRSTLQDLEERYRTWRLVQKHHDKRSPYTECWKDWLEDLGMRLADEFQYQKGGKLQEMVADCVGRVKDIKNVYFRFNLLADDAEPRNPYPHVPFELLYDRLEGEFVRVSSPVARRHCIARGARAVVRSGERFGLEQLTGPVLFVQSDADGDYEASEARFHGSLKLHVGRLTALDEELKGAKGAWERQNTAGAWEPLNTAFDTLELKANSGVDDAVEQLHRAVSPPRGEKPGPQIVHFAGHSVCADDGKLYLVLPGSRPGELKLLNFDDFAHFLDRAGLRLLILSCCESTTPHALFRATQYGVPAVVGFRWEVSDTEAAYFTKCLHEGLAGHKPLAQAFHLAVKAVRAQYTESPTFASAMLVAEDEAWVG